MSLAEALEAELLRIDPQEGGAKTKAELLARVVREHVPSQFDDPFQA